MLSVALDLTLLRRVRGNAGRSVKSATLESLDHCIGEVAKLRRHVQAKRFGRLQVEHKLELCRLHGQIAGFFASQDTVELVQAPRQYPVEQGRLIGGDEELLATPVDDAKGLAPVPPGLLEFAQRPPLVAFLDGPEPDGTFVIALLIPLSGLCNRRGIAGSRGAQEAIQEPVSPVLVKGFAQEGVVAASPEALGTEVIRGSAAA